MKKLISILLIAGLLLTGSIAYAEGTEKDTGKRINSFKSFVNDAKPQLDTIKENRQRISELSKEALELYKETKQKVRELLKSKDEISQAQVEAIKQSIDILVSDKKLLVGTKGDIFKNSVDLRAARKNKDSDAYKAALDKIIETQNERIGTLNKVIQDLRAIDIT